LNCVKRGEGAEFVCRHGGAEHLSSRCTGTCSKGKFRQEQTALQCPTKHRIRRETGRSRRFGRQSVAPNRWPNNPFLHFCGGPRRPSRTYAAPFPEHSKRPGQGPLACRLRSTPLFFARTGGVVVQYMYGFLAAIDRVLPWYLEQHGRGIEEGCRLSSDLQWDRS